jgi:predicted dehydrogenase
MDVSFESFPADHVGSKSDAYVTPNFRGVHVPTLCRYKDAIATFSPGDLAIIFTPDDTHFDIAVACIEHGMHVCVTKPLVHTLRQHRELAALAQQRRLLTYVEVHKRWDPM